MRRRRCLLLRAVLTLGATDSVQGECVENHPLSRSSAWIRRSRQIKLLPLETGAAKHWPALRGLKWDRSLRPALRAGRPRLCTDSGIPACALGFALFTTLGVVFELLVVKEELLACREYEIGAAVNTLQYSILEFHGRLPNRELHRSGHSPVNNAVPVPCLCLVQTRARAAFNGAAKTSAE